MWVIVLSHKRFRSLWHSYLRLPPVYLPISLERLLLLVGLRHITVVLQSPHTRFKFSIQTVSPIALMRSMVDVTALNNKSYKRSHALFLCRLFWMIHLRSNGALAFMHELKLIMLLALLISLSQETMQSFSPCQVHQRIWSMFPKSLMDSRLVLNGLHQWQLVVSKFLITECSQIRALALTIISSLTLVARVNNTPFKPWHLASLIH